MIKQLITIMIITTILPGRLPTRFSASSGVVFTVKTTVIWGKDLILRINRLIDVHIDTAHKIYRKLSKLRYIPKGRISLGTFPLTTQCPSKDNEYANTF